ncbi:MAG: hypothetical protein ACM3S2_17535 [Ignavibacteriales bacterium]
MNLDWSGFLQKMVNVTMKENYGMKYDTKSDSPLYEIVFKTGRLIGVYDDGLLLEATRESQQIKIFIPHHSIKCVEIFNV